MICLLVSSFFFSLYSLWRNAFGISMNARAESNIVCIRWYKKRKKTWKLERNENRIPYINCLMCSGPTSFFIQFRLSILTERISNSTRPNLFIFLFTLYSYTNISSKKKSPTVGYWTNNIVFTYGACLVTENLQFAQTKEKWKKKKTRFYATFFDVKKKNSCFIESIDQVNRKPFIKWTQLTPMQNHTQTHAHI